MRAGLARGSRSALVELISLAIPLLLVINLPGGAESRARLLTHINRWHKVACIPENLKDTDHYICDYEGHVLCLPGWSDEMNACTTPLCQPQCSQNGNCSRPNTCECEVGWAGADCSKCVCLPGCVNGDCNLPFECLCRDGWEGMLCNKPTCKEGCDHGTCSMPGECICNPGWSGENCDVCTTLPGCSPENGYCNKPMQCRCKPGYTGQFCKEPICREGCSEVNGWCEKPGECWCRVGWDGPTCTDCVKYPGCVNGGCEEPWECNCANGWGGMHCNQPHNTTNFPYPTSANNLRASPRGAQESTAGITSIRSGGLRLSTTNLTKPTPHTARVTLPGARSFTGTNTSAQYRDPFDQLISGGPTLVPGSPDPILSQADGLENDLLFGGHHFDENIVQGRAIHVHHEGDILTPHSPVQLSDDGAGVEDPISGGFNTLNGVPNVNGIDGLQPVPQIAKR